MMQAINPGITIHQKQSENGRVEDFYMTMENGIDKEMPLVQHQYMLSGKDLRMQLIIIISARK